MISIQEAIPDPSISNKLRPLMRGGLCGFWQSWYRHIPTRLAMNKQAITPQPTPNRDHSIKRTERTDTAKMPVDHTSVTVPMSKSEAFKNFLLAALKPLGTKVVMDFSQYNSVGLGEQLAYFWISGMEMSGEEEAVAMKMLKKTHLAFTAESEFYLHCLYGVGGDGGG